MTATPPTLPADLCSPPPSSPALSTPPPPSASQARFNPFAPVLPAPGSAAPTVRKRAHPPTPTNSSSDAEDAPPIPKRKPFGEIGKEEVEARVADRLLQRQSAGVRSPAFFVPRTRQVGRPVVRRRQVEDLSKDDGRTTAVVEGMEKLQVTVQTEHEPKGDIAQDEANKDQEDATDAMMPYDNNVDDNM